MSRQARQNRARRQAALEADRLIAAAMQRAAFQAAHTAQNVADGLTPDRSTADAWGSAR